VYPAGPGEDVQTNRESANARARYLEKVHGVKTSVMADDKIGPEEKNEHLLVLGWNNRLFGAGETRAPFQRKGASWSFLGIEESDPRADLLFFSVSPFNADKSLTFWSRIDPERDRFLILPTIGSDWAVYRDFVVQKQGMFDRGAGWPPERNPDVEMDHAAARASEAGALKTKRAGQYDVTWDPAATTNDEIAAVEKARQAAWARVTAIFGTPAASYRISLRVYKNEDVKKRWTGIADPAHSLPKARELHMTLRAATSPTAHEEVHLLARNAYGPCYLTSFYEGLAVAEDGSYKGLDLELHAAKMLDQGALPSLDALLDEETARALSDAARFPSAALMVRWIQEVGGSEGMARAYGLREGRVEALAEVLHQPSASLPSAFRRWVEQRIAARRDDVAHMRAISDAEARYKAGDYPGVVDAMKRALKLRPEDPQTLFNLASAEMRVRSYSDAEAHIRQLLALPGVSQTSQFTIFGQYQLGRILDLQGRREEALACYRKVLELPDQHDAHRLASEAIQKPPRPEDLD
jgi:hypothetical protein